MIWGFLTDFYLCLDAHRLKWLDLSVVFPWEVAELVSGKLIIFLYRGK